ncbi:(d)CMP kinase [Allofrancisella guangzhouensis]|uniref:Cytidylate kinase n=1 Tax=Allofrancisella guangzhouensis TaxID=594679 RepID=A0A0A8EAJ0_9GAMM|nr:(d)CMP kinase [Allofrancisella guangzhouensis]AJC49181.1 cytidylate kinase [Allofrancisella guangzhouensis]MBK2026760.1 (d)CMP kinase [Allofrancisella guangzhouensis]MBK2044432.1 (d)CMP kinase [Allofrancisella guangzhouensis]MBK2045360.1 (d)CMP kinase [Allofrancisella guangzhouensis]
MNNSKIITIDGPSGVGKGTLAQALAKHLNYKFLDSGAIYRLAALHCSRNGTSLDNETEAYKTLGNLDIRFEIGNCSIKTILANNDVSKEIRTEKIGMLASKIAVYPTVREILLNKQRDFATELGLVADGRDMGTVVFPDAKHKFFLDANSQVRAQRRFNQLKEKNQNPNFETILADIEKRDFQDRNRKIAPLKPADDAIVIDTSDLSAEEVFDKVLDTIKNN